tara:strand:- start:7801 stop:8475 length:675 start_codon:yes stop_codon:yes gene_type:complete
MNLGRDFQAYAKDKMRVSDNQLNQYGAIQNEVYGSMTPYILEEREMRVTQMDIFSRLMRERILWVSGPVNQYMSDVVKAQLLYLESVSDDDITMYIDTPGGSVINGLSMINTMGLVKPEIKTINNGMCASMGSVLLGAGTKGKRFMLPDAMVMLHQVSSGMEGNVQDMRISMKLSEKFNNRLFDLLGGFCGKDPEEVLKDSERDLWLDSKEALAYGIIDEIIGG